MQTYKHIILGTGQATGTLLARLISTKNSIAVIEGAKVGGSCVNYGCTPTKTLVASARAIHLARRGSFYGFETGPVQVNFPRIRERMNTVRNNSNEGLVDWIESTPNVDLIREWGHFTGPKTIKVGDREIKGEFIYINTGTRPFLPPIEGIDSVPWLDSAKLLELHVVPDHLLIIGGGYIGLEFAQVYRRFGAEVTVIQRGDQLMPQEDADVAQSIQEVLEGEGIQFLLQANAAKVAEKNNQIHLQVEQAGTTTTLQGSHLLIATGRRPNSDRLNLEATDIKTNKRGYIEVDAFCRTGVPGVFALGDVNGQGAFTHTSVNDAEVVLDYHYGGKRRISDRMPIYALFTDPPLGRMGISEKEALASGKKVLKATRAMKDISRAKEMGETQGFAKLLVDAETDLIIGAAIHGPGGDEVINMFASIMHSGIPCKNYREVVLVHPTISELMPWVLDGLKLIED